MRIGERVPCQEKPAWLMETLGDGRGEEHHVPVLGCWVQFWQEAVLAVALSLHFVLVEAAS